MSKIQNVDCCGEKFCLISAADKMRNFFQTKSKFSKNKICCEYLKIMSRGREAKRHIYIYILLNRDVHLTRACGEINQIGAKSFPNFHR